MSAESKSGLIKELLLAAQTDGLQHSIKDMLIRAAYTIENLQEYIDMIGVLTNLRGAYR